MHLPSFVYESYPVLYVLLGIGSMSMVESFLSFICGILLAMAGIAILFIRRNYRMMKVHLAHLT